MNEWEMVGTDYWVFGEKVRGTVRKPVAEVCANKNLPGQWTWHTGELGKPGWYGAAFSRLQAIEHVEKTLGIIPCDTTGERASGTASITGS